MSLSFVKSRISPTADSQEAAFSSLISLDIQISEAEKEISSLLDIVELKLQQLDQRLSEKIFKTESHIGMLSTKVQTMDQTTQSLTRSIQAMSHSIEQLAKSQHDLSQQVKKMGSSFSERITRLEQYRPLYYYYPYQRSHSSLS